MSDARKALDEALPFSVQDVEHAITGAAKTVNSALNGVADATGVTDRVAQNPYGRVAAALATGYVVGGGLFTPTTARLVQLGVKVASIPVVRNQLLGLAEAVVDGLLEAARKNDET